MGDILFLAHRIPFPPDRGDKIRSHHLLRALAKIAPVHVGCFADVSDDWQHEGELAALAASHRLLERTKPLPLAGIEALVTNRAVSLTAFADPGLHRWVTETIANRDIETIFVFSGQMGQYAPADFKGRLIVDLCDVDSQKFASYAKRSAWPRNLLERREARLLAQEEASLAQRADRLLLVSDPEAALFRELNPDLPAARVAAVRNGIDTRFFDPQAVAPHRDLTAEPGPHLVFTGQMDYPPNILAVERVIEKILPRVREVHPAAQFHIVGRAPVSALRRHDGEHGVRVWGAVPDMRPLLAAADIVLAPLTIGRGVQNKVLEAMAMGRPVLLSPEAATGIDARDGHEFAVEASDDEMVARAIELLADGPAALAMAAAARRYVREHQGWPAMLAPLQEMMQIPAGKGARDAA